MPTPALAAATRALRSRELVEQSNVCASDQDADRVPHLVDRVAEVGSAREIKDSLLMRGHQRRAELGAHALGIEQAGVALDEPNGCCPVRQFPMYPRPFS